MAALVLGFTSLPAWVAASFALLSALPALLLNLPESTTAPAYVLEETLRGAWLAWQAISVMVAGLYFNGATLAAKASVVSEQKPIGDVQLFTLVILVGPFVESAVGFGVGIVVIIGHLLQRDVPPVTAALLSLLSQTLVPWGGFAVGSLIGAEIAEISLSQLATASALLSLPLMLAWLPFYWRLADQAGAPSRSRVSDVTWLLLSMLMLVLANIMLDPQIALITAFGLAIVLRQISFRGLSSKSLWHQLIDIWPYAVLCSILLATRLFDPLGVWLQSLMRLEPFDDQLAFMPFYHPGFWLLAIGSLALFRNRRSMGPVLKNTMLTGWRPVLVTLLFVIMARWMISAGAARTMALGIASVLGPYTVLTSPLLAGLAGFLTGSNTASNAMMMPVQSALISSSGVPAVFLSAIQNVSGSAMTALSPARIVFASTLAGGLDQRELYRRAAGFAAPPLIILILLCAIAVLL